MSEKKTTRVGSSEGASQQERKQWEATPEAKGKAMQFRMISIIGWLIAIGLQIFAIAKLIKNETLMWLIVVIVIALALAVVGNIFWKKANRLDPASKENKVKFFIQNQLGAIMSALAFLPLLIVILTNKDIDGKTKGIAGAVAGLALLIGVGTGIDFAPPSIEQYTDQMHEVEFLNNGVNEVYWTTYGKKYHLYKDCQHINKATTDEHFVGTVAESREISRIDGLCKTCQNKRLKEKGKTEEDMKNYVEEAAAQVGDLVQQNEE